MDVDGDGVPELVLVRAKPRGDHPPELAVHWSDGRVGSSRVQGRFFNDGIRGLAVDDRPGDELLVRDMLSYRWSVWGHRDGGWRGLDVSRPELLRERVARDGHGYGLLTGGYELVGYRSVEEFDVGYDYAFPPGPVYAVDTWRWQWWQDRLFPRPAGVRCVSADDAGRFVDCP